MLFRSTSLSSSHYAGKWVISLEAQHHDLKLVNQLGYEYATAPDSPAKEELLLKLLELFHAYLMKYAVMIIRGTIPPLHSPAGRDAKEMLRTLAPRGAKPSKELTLSVCKMLHLSFKNMTTEEIYDTLVFCLIRAMRQYDPLYSDKTRQVCEVIDQLPTKFNESDFSGRVPFDCVRILRSLARKGFLASVTGKKKKVVGYQRGAAWPPPPEFFESGPIGFVYVIQMWFRYYLEHYISSRMSEVESKQGSIRYLKHPFTPQSGLFHAASVS